MEPQTISRPFARVTIGLALGLLLALAIAPSAEARSYTSAGANLYRGDYGAFACEAVYTTAANFGCTASLKIPVAGFAVGPACFVATTVWSPCAGGSMGPVKAPTTSDNWNVGYDRHFA